MSHQTTTSSSSGSPRATPIGHARAPATATAGEPPGLEAQLAAFRARSFLAMPIAGAVVWTLIGVAGWVLPTMAAAWALFIGTGGIFYVGVGVARLTGEDLLGRNRDAPFFDRLFLLTVTMAVLVYSIAIPFFMIEPTSLPLTVGILTGLMWVPLAGLLQHWVGLFHGVGRTVLVLAAWYAFPADRFVAVPAVIVAVYLVTIRVLATRPKG